MIIQRDDGRFIPVEFGRIDGRKALQIRERNTNRRITEDSSAEEEGEFAKYAERTVGFSTPLEIHRHFPGIAVGMPGSVPREGGYRALLGVGRG
jgi:hypothetical protein